MTEQIIEDKNIPHATLRARLLQNPDLCGYDPVIQRAATLICRNQLGEDVIQVLINSGKIGSEVELPALMAAMNESSDQVKVTRQDRGGFLHLPWKDLREKLHKPPVLSEIGVWGRIGSLSHSLVMSFLSGDFYHQLGYHPENAQQLELFNANVNKNVPRLTSSFLSELRDCTNQLRDSIQPNNQLDTPQLVENLEEMIKALIPAYLSEFYRLGPLAQKLAQYTLPTWSEMLAYYFELYQSRGRIPVFTEIPALGLNPYYSGPRQDGMQVRFIEGFKPKKHELARLFHVIQKRPRSTGEAIHLVEQIFGNAVDFLNIELKFEVGDNPGTEGILDISKLTKPDPAHRQQALIYPILGNLDFWRFQGGNETLDLGWFRRRPMRTTQILYFGHTLLNPLIFEETIAPEKQRQAFLDYFVAPQSLQQTRAQARQLATELIRTAIKLTDEQKRTVLPSDNLINHYQQLPLQMDGRSTTPDPLIQFIDFQRTYVDQLHPAPGVVNFTGRDDRGKSHYHLHLNNLITAIESGKVQTARDFNWEKGGFIHCFFNTHAGGDRTPSLQLSMEEGAFYCFGCHIGGIFEERSIPKGLKIRARSLSPFDPSHLRAVRTKGQIIRFTDLEIPQPQFDLMNRVSELYTAALFNRNTNYSQRAKDFLVHERWLDLSLAQKYRVGVNEVKYVIDGILDLCGTQGKDAVVETYHLLISSGLIRLSDTLSSSNDVIRALKNRGLKESDIRQPLVGKDCRWGFPYAPNPGWLAVPLEVGIGQTNNFYYRTLVPKPDPRRKHRKLSSKSDHGPFNVKPFVSPNDSEIIIVEGALDALALMQMGVENVSAIIGTNNGLAISELIHVGKESIGIALDYDVAGIENTKRIEEALIDLGCASKIYDFTAQFMAKNPSFKINEGLDWGDIIKFVTKNRITVVF